MSLVSGKADIRDRDVTFEEHLQQVMSIMSWLMRNTTEKAITLLIYLRLHSHAVLSQALRGIANWS